MDILLILLKNFTCLYLCANGVVWIASMGMLLPRKWFIPFIFSPGLSAVGAVADSINLLNNPKESVRMHRACFVVLLALYASLWLLFTSEAIHLESEVYVSIIHMKLEIRSFMLSSLSNFAVPCATAIHCISFSASQVFTLKFAYNKYRTPSSFAILSTHQRFAFHSESIKQTLDQHEQIFMQQASGEPIGELTPPQLIR